MAATISQLMGDGKRIFEERTGAEGSVAVVSRDAALQVGLTGQAEGAVASQGKFGSGWAAH